MSYQPYKKIFRKYPVQAAYLFGSQATGKAGKLSDYDFAVLLDEKKVSEKQYAKYQLEIISELLRAVKTDHLDLIILNNPKTPLFLKYNVIKGGKIIYEKNKKAENERKNLEFHILRRWLDEQYFEKVWSDVYVHQVAKGAF